MSKAKETPVLKVIKTQSRSLPCKLTQDEILKKGQELAQVCEDIKAEESRQTDQKAQMKARMTEMESRRESLSITVRRQEEFRDVQVVYEISDDGLVREIRKDTGDVMLTRLAYDDEKQLALLPEKGNDVNE